MADEDKPLRGFKDALADVFKDPTRDAVRELLKQNTGEAANLDFKETWPADDKVARHVLAFGNSGGGCLVVGVAERPDHTLDLVGLPTLRDKVDVTKKLNALVPDALRKGIELYDFAYDTSDYGALQGKKFQLVLVLPDPEHMPFVAESGSSDARRGAVYVRRGTESVEASQAELQRIINDRLATGKSTAAAMDLEDHLDQLEVLEGRIPRRLATESDISTVFASISRMYAQQLQGVLGGSGYKPNPKFPKEDFEAFVLRMFEAKKKRIMAELDVS